MNTQSNTQAGPKPFLTTADLTGKEGYLAKLVNSSGKAALALPAAVTDITPFVITEVETASSAVGKPLTSEANARVRLNGTCAPGDFIGLAAGGDLGKATKVTTAGARYFAIAEETGVDEQLVLVRPFSGVIPA